MDNALLMRCFEPLGDLLPDGERIIDRDWPFRDAVSESRAFNQLHHERMNAAPLLEAVDLRDVRMVQRRERLGFTLESCQTLRVLCERLREYLDGDWPTELRICRPVDLAHPAHADLGDDFIRADASPRSQSHEIRLEL